MHRHSGGTVAPLANRMNTPHDILLAKLRRHSDISEADAELLRDLPFRTRQLDDGEDLIRQNDTPQFSAVVLRGIVARYHTLPTGRRQYLSLHIPGDWPDAQSLLLPAMDHSVCALGPSEVALLRHDALTALFERAPPVGFAIWRETLIDAAIFREAITNNSGRATEARMAHFFCEIFFRARAAGLTDGAAFPLPITQDQIGETLGMALVSVNRTIRDLRATGIMDFRNRVLTVSDPSGLSALADFDPGYLHLDTPAP